MTIAEQSLRVLMISPQFRPIVGGYERAAERLSAAIAEKGGIVTVLAERRESSWPVEESVSGFQIRRLWCLHRRYLHTLSTLLSFGAYLLVHGRKFHVWHAHQYGHLAALAVAMGSLLGRPVVLKITSSAAMGIANSLGNGMFGHLVAFFHRRVAACVALSAETRQEALDFGIPAEKIHLIPGGVDGAQFRPATSDERKAARNRLNLTCERLVLFVGRLSTEKNPQALVRAWGEIDPAARMNTKLAMVGDGPDEKSVHDLAKRVSNSIIFPGRRADVDDWYRAADVYVISSELEGLSNTMIEAMATGLPVVSTAVSGSSILAEPPPAGLLVEIGDTAELSRSLESLLRDEMLRLFLGNNARRKFEAAFSLSVQTERMISLYEKLRFPVRVNG